MSRALAPLRVPHEIEPQARIFTAWPVHSDWAENMGLAGAEVAGLVRAATGVQPEDDETHPDALSAKLRAASPSPAATVFVRDAAREAAQRMLGETVTIRGHAYGDIWLRDTGPVFVLGDDGARAVAFRFNGWGGKYLYPEDVDVAERVAASLDMALDRVDMVGEGGALEFDGEGTCLTTRQCLLNKNRNPNLTERDVADRLAASLGVEKTLWLDEGLLGDHTDGHIDNIARFAAPGVVICQAPAGPGDPNAALHDATARALETMTDAGGRKLEVVRVPSPGLVADEDGRPRAASHMNFIHAGARVIVPVYDTPTAAAALAALAEIFPGRDVIALAAKALITGGGAFHCVTTAAPASSVKR